MARHKWRGNFERDLRKLICQVTGFEEDDENTKICEQFSTTNLKYHRFLDVDSHKVTRSMQGICEKFMVHSHCDKAEILKILTDEFLTAAIFEERDHGKTDTHYSLLSLLLLLADSPVHATYKLRELKPAPVPQKEDFDWTAHLLEGESTLEQTYNDEELSDWSDLSDDESDTGIINKREQSKHVLPDNYVNSEHNLIASKSSLVFGDTALLTISDEPTMFKGEEWLKRNVVRQYWRGHGQGEIVCGRHKSSNFVSDWEYYQQLTDPLFTPHSRVVLTETELMREAIWMLSGVSDVFAFVYDGKCYKLRDDIIVTHLTGEGLEECLRDFMDTAAHVKALHEFVDKVTENSCADKCSDEPVEVSQTYQAFSSSVQSFLGDFYHHLTNLEKKIIKQEETMTLTRLHSELSMWLPKINLVFGVYTCGVKQTLTTNCQRASQLLSALYQCLLEYDTVSSEAADMMNTLLPMWIKTSKPFINFVDDWITNGFLIDPTKEFIVQRNENVKSLDENFWETAVTLHLSQCESPDRTSNVQELSDDRESCDNAECWAPKFLNPVMKEIILAGKSMEMLQNLGRLADVVGKKDDIFYRAKPLYDIFLQSVEKSLGCVLEKDNITCAKTLDSPSTLIFSEQIEKQMMMKGVYDPLLRINFQVLFPRKRYRADQECQESEKEGKPCDNQVSLQPLELLLQECLYPPIRQKYQHVCSKLVEILKEEYHLMEYLDIMKHFFLMEAGDTMFDFYTPIFDKIRLFEPWLDVSIVNFMLYEALESHYPDECNRLAVELVTDYQKKIKCPINVTDCLKLHYKVPWPVDVIINSRTQDMYNQIFNFLLQVKRAKYCLDQLRFLDLQNENILKTLSYGEETFSSSLEETIPRAGRIHRMQILRMRLLFFVNCLHNYIMTRILHSSGLEFKIEMKHAEDLDEIIALHDRYVNTIHERCLLHKKVEFLKEAITKVLNLSLSFQTKWDQGVDEISGVARLCTRHINTACNEAILNGTDKRD